MFAVFTGGQISETDYFESRARERKQAWLFMDWTTWHVILPEPPPLDLAIAFARPVTGRRELNGWQWRLELDGRHYLLPRDQIKGLRPPLPQPFTHQRRSLMLYSSYVERGSGQSFFGNMSPGVQPPKVVPLFIVRDVKPMKGIDR